MFLDKKYINSMKINSNEEEEFKQYRKELNEIIFEIENKIKNYVENIINGKERVIFYNNNGEIKYNCDFEIGNFDGFGKLYEKKELKYEGFFKMGLYLGKGILYQVNKKIYEGHFKNNKYDGIGLEYLLNGKRRRKALYSCGKICNQCNGIIYNEKDEEIYNGLLVNGNPKEGKSIIIYSDEEHILYKGDFKSFKYDGKGILYYENSNQIKFNGIFKEDYYVKGEFYNIKGYKEYDGEFKNNIYEGIGMLYHEHSNKIYSKGTFKEGEIINGLLYDIDGKKIYEGEIRNNFPKEGKNLKLYKINGYLKYEGDIFDYSYHGNGKIYEGGNLIFDGILNKGNKVKGILYHNNIKKYDGEFKNEVYNGFGKLYILDDENNNYLYYEGFFINMEISGKGIKYYKNGSKKIEGEFTDIFTYDGIYYNPYGKIIFKGKISHTLPFNIDQPLYNDNGYLIYNNKDYGNKVFQIDSKSKVTDCKNVSNVLLISRGITGKTTIFLRMIENIFREIFVGTIGIDKEILFYKYNDAIFKMILWDSSGTDRLRASAKMIYHKNDIIILVFDLTNPNTLDDSLLDEIKKNSGSNRNLIYLLGNKLDIDMEYLKECRNKAKILIDSGVVDKYFEISAKTGKGFEQFSKILKIDAANYSKFSDKNKNVYYHYYEKASYGLYSLGFKTLNKYINY